MEADRAIVRNGALQIAPSPSRARTRCDEADRRLRSAFSHGSPHASNPTGGR